MPSVPRAFLVSGVCATVMLPVFAQQVPTAPALSVPQVILPAPPNVGPQQILGGVPLDLGALPQAASRPATPPADTDRRTTSAETNTDQPSALAKPAKRVAAAAPTGSHTEHVLFDRLPVQILLAPGRERLVQFPFVPLIDVPPSLQGLLEVQIIEDTAYLTAHGPVPRTRLVAHAIEGATKLPLDVEAIDGKDARPILQIHLPNEASADDDDAAAGAARGNPEPAVGMIELTRYAAQVLYAPSRLIPTYAGVRQEPVDRKPVVGLYRGGEVETAPLGAWSSGALHVTAIRFTNRATHPVELDMERLRGRWIAATPQHWRLLPKGSEADTTAVYLISDRPYATVALWR